MKYTTEVTINLPRAHVIELFDNSDNLKKWQPGLQSFEHMSGDPGKPGAKYRMVYDEDGRRTEMIETVTQRDLPDVFAGTYEAKGVVNWITNRFVEESPDTTRWITENEFRFSGVWRIISFFMRGSFPKQTLEFMNNFKEFAEGAGEPGIGDRGSGIGDQG